MRKQAQKGRLKQSELFKLRERRRKERNNKVRYEKGCCKEKTTNCCPAGWDKRKWVYTAVRVFQNIMPVFQHDRKEDLEKIWWRLWSLQRPV